MKYETRILIGLIAMSLIAALAAVVLAEMGSALPRATAQSAAADLEGHKVITITDPTAFAAFCRQRGIPYQADDPTVLADVLTLGYRDAGNVAWIGPIFLAVNAMCLIVLLINRKRDGRDRPADEAVE